MKRYLQPFWLSPVIGKNHLCAGRLAGSVGEALQCLPFPIHENGILKRTHGQRPALPWRWGRPVFGLWAVYSVAASHLDQDSALALAMQRFVPITAAGQRWIHTSFPFNRPLHRGLTCTPSFYTAAADALG